MNNKIKATTLVELLVYILISGIILLIIFEGFDLLKIQNVQVKQKIEGKNQKFQSYTLLEIVISKSDSMRRVGDSIFFYSRGEKTALLFKENALGILRIANRTDTLFHNVNKIRFRYNDKVFPFSDSLCIFFKIDSAISSRDASSLIYSIP